MEQRTWARGMVGLLVLLTAAPAVAAEPVKIGVLAPLTGIYSILGDRAVKGVEFAAAELNAAGGVLGRPVEVVVRDYETNPEVAVRQAQRLILQDRVAAIVGPLHGGAAIAVSSLTKRQRVLQFPFAAVEELTTTHCQPYLWRVAASASQTSRGGAEVGHRLGLASWATISSDFSYGRSVIEYFIDHLRALNPSAIVVKQAWPKLGEEDFGAYITELLRAQPRALYVGLFAGDLVRFVKQARTFGVFDRMTVFLDSGGAHELLKTWGDEAPFGHWASARYVFTASATETNRRFVDAFHRRYGVYPDFVTHDGYASVKAFALAAERVRSLEPTRVVSALAGLRWETPKGELWFRPEDHQAVQPTIWGRIAKSARYPFPVLDDVVTVPADRVTLPVDRSGQGCR